MNLLRRESLFAPVPKALGADMELNNFVENLECQSGSGEIAAKLLLREVDGVRNAWAAVSTQDSHRTWCRGGQCIYIDLDHCECALPLTTNLFDFEAAHRAILRLARRAMERCNERIADQGLRVAVLANTCDQHDGNSFGAHLNVMLHPGFFDALFDRRLHLLLQLGAFQVSSIIYAGSGLVHSRPDDHPFFIAQRPCWTESLVGLQTTYKRPLLNSRDEGHARAFGEIHEWAKRLHVIFYDHLLNESASALRNGALSLVLALLERGASAPELMLDEPLDALENYNRDPDLRSTARCCDGRKMTALEHQQAWLDRCAAFVEAGHAEGIVPHAPWIIEQWASTLELLRQRDWTALSRRLDWVLKRELLQDAMSTHGMDWPDAGIRMLDLLYHHLDPEQGLYESCRAAGAVDTLVDDTTARRFEIQPPADTRAWTRGRLIAQWPEEILEIDWSRMVFRGPTARPGDRVVLDLANPLGATRAENEALFERHRDDCYGLLRAMGAGAYGGQSTFSSYDAADETEDNETEYGS